jgi:hypothetical protein
MKEEVVDVNYANLEIEDIIKYCQGQGEEAITWLKETAEKEYEVPIYPKILVPRYDEDGNPVYTKKGKIAKKRVYDKTAKPIGKEMRKISYVELKSAFVEKFELDSILKEPKAEKLSMYDLIKNL